MAFILENFTAARGNLSTYTGSESPAIHTYQIDPADMVALTGYFDPVKDQLRIGDLIYQFNGTTAIFLRVLQAEPTVQVVTQSFG